LEGTDEARAGVYEDVADGQEVEMLPTLLSVGHNHFPGIFDAVYVVNAGWTHRSMWSIIKRVLPKSALDKIIFLDKRQDIQRVFDLDILPSRTCYGYVTADDRSGGK
jgi:hypothetical protein